MMVGRNTIAGELLRGYVERLEEIGGREKQLTEDAAVVMAEAKSKGLIPAAVRFVLKKRQMKPSERQEAETLEDMYLHAMGMAQEPPLFRAVGLMKVDIASREQVIAAMKALVPANGSITVEAGGTPVRLTRDGAGNVTVTEITLKPEAPASPSARPAPAPAEVPAVDERGAWELGRAAFLADTAIIANPFPFGDARRPRWDAGWRSESGSDGMDD